MERWKRRAVELIGALVLGEREDISVVPHYPQKTMINMPEKSFFIRSSPERCGVSSKRLYSMLCRLEGEERANLHSLMVLRGGEVICECYAEGYARGEWHISHSMSKTVCGMVIGTLVDEGVLGLQDRVADVFPELEYRDKRFARITVEHLLSMTSGVDFAEMGSVTESEWTAAFFSSPLKFMPGSKFSYNSMNSYLLARIAERVSGKSFGALVNERIFMPLGITNYFWEKSPEGTEKGGWGLYLSAESWAKLGVMILGGGRFCGKRVLSEEWVDYSTSVKAVADDFCGRFDYASHLWRDGKGREILFNGMLGQNVWICPENDIVVVMLSGNNEMFGASPALEIVRSYLGGRLNDDLDRRDLRLLREKESRFFGCRGWIGRRPEKRGILYRLGIRRNRSFDSAWENILGNYSVCKNNVGITPMIVRAMQNNLRASVGEISLLRDGEAIRLEYTDGGEAFSIRVGLYGYETNVINLRGEYYTVRAMGCVFRSQGGESEYRIQLIFSETASERRIIIKRCGEKTLFELSEMPNNRVVESLINHFSRGNKTVSVVIDMVERRLGVGSVSRLLKRTFNPTLIGVNSLDPQCENLVIKENRRIDEEKQRLRPMCNLIEKLFGEGDCYIQKEGAVSDKSPKKYISEWIGKIAGRRDVQGQNDN